MRNLRRYSLLPCCLGLAFLLHSSSAARAADGPKYIALRKELHCNRALTYKKVQEMPSQYAGRVIELRGKVSGSASGDDTLSILLAIENNVTVALNVPLSEAGPINEITPAYLRVLAKVGKTDGAGDVPLKVLAVAAEGSIGPYDEQEEKEAARRAREAQMRANKRTTGRGYNTPARGNSTLRELPSDPSDPGLLNYFSPYLTARAKAIYLPYLRFIAGHNPRLTRPEAGYIAAALLRAADALNVDPRLVVAVVVAESDFKPTETSRTNAQGLMQLMPSTAQILGVRNSYNPDENLRGGVTYLREQLDRFASKANPDGSMSDEQISLACAAYNAGPGAVKKYGGIPPYKETQRYIKRILALYHELCQ